MQDHTIAIVGLGYVGLPLAVAFGRRRPTIGYDLNESKLKALEAGIDPSGEISEASIQAAEKLEFTGDAARLGEASVIIIVVPTPIDAAKQPDLLPLVVATRTVGQHMRPGTTIVFESTVYPGCTEEICVPILEAESEMLWIGRDTGAELEEASQAVFNVGYSPERINPGDRLHTLDSVIKVVSGDTKQTCRRLVELYETIVDAGVYTATSIKVAEAAKVIENTQRDLNISLMNEFAMIFDRLDIDTLDVLEAAGTKWNFLPFRPGLVGGHCIGVDPYYLTHKAEKAGYHPEVVLSGRRINDGMGKYIAEQTVKQLAANAHPIAGSRVVVLGFTFKENCSDTRNSKVPDVVSELCEYGCSVEVYDPLISELNLENPTVNIRNTLQELSKAEALVFAVAHDQIVETSMEIISTLLKDDGVIIDVKGVLDRDLLRDSGIAHWRL